MAVIEIDDDYCPVCDDYLCVSGTPCKEHPFVCAVKADPVLSALDDAMRDGTPWGDIICYEEEQRLNMRTPQQKEADLRNEVQKRRKEIDGLRKYVVDKSIRQHCETVSGKLVLKHKYRKACENITLKAEVLADGSTYEGGCWAHCVGACPFMHPGEEGLFTFTDNRPLKLVNGKQPEAFSFKNVTFLSSKPTSAFKAPVKSTMQDSW